MDGPADAVIGEGAVVGNTVGGETEVESVSVVARCGARREDPIGIAEGTLEVVLRRAVGALALAGGGQVGDGVFGAKLDERPTADGIRVCPKAAAERLGGGVPIDVKVGVGRG